MHNLPTEPPGIPVCGPRRRREDNSEHLLVPRYPKTPSKKKMSGSSCPAMPRSSPPPEVNLVSSPGPMRPGPLEKATPRSRTHANGKTSKKTSSCITPGVLYISRTYIHLQAAARQDGEMRGERARMRWQTGDGDDDEARRSGVENVHGRRQMAGCGNPSVRGRIMGMGMGEWGPGWRCETGDRR